jgi:hypothetical protein
MLKQGSIVIKFNPHSDCGYYFVAPGKQPLIDRGGVKVDEDIIDEANKYFHVAQKH